MSQNTLQHHIVVKDDMKDSTMSDNSKRETDFLDLPGSTPIEDRSQTGALGPAWKIQLRIGEHSVLLDLADTMMIGRAVDDQEDATDLSLDLSAFGGYQGGVSRRHAVIRQHEGNLYLEDLGSTNGTRINGFQLTARRRYRLRDGDEIEFARLTTRLRLIRPA